MASRPLPKMMLGFVVRRCAAAVGHIPSPEEFADWANSYSNGKDTVFLFGRRITIHEARLILRHPERPVSSRGAAPHEAIGDDPRPQPGKVASFAEAAARLRACKRRP